MSEQILTTKEACTYLGVSYWTLIHKLVKDLTPNRREESIVELREKYKKTNKGKSMEEIMQTVKSRR